ncbi:MAG: SDR family oxidoreductase [Acidimicrobiales bacterium]
MASDDVPSGEPVAVVTGGNRGVGLACARALAADGHRVVVTWRTEPGPDFPGVRCDVRDPDAVDAAFDQIEAEHGPVAVLVANAGTAERNLAIRMKPSSFADVVGTNLVGSFAAARRAAQTMVRRRQGRLVFVSSTSALYGTPGVASYSASKAGLIGLCRSLARELGSRGITANVVAPGLLENMRDLAPGADDWIARTPLGRVGRVEEAAAVVRFLCSPRAAAITGTVFPVDGGFGMGIG